MANQQEAGKKDPLTGMAHSEAHYFNSYNHHGPYRVALMM
jgi:protein arginine N-methyltransferase 1